MRHRLLFLTPSLIEFLSRFILRGNEIQNWKVQKRLKKNIYIGKTEASAPHHTFPDMSTDLQSFQERSATCTVGRGRRRVPGRPVSGGGDQGQKAVLLLPPIY
ncbi:hypothetical protein H6P81_003181 [Aristolochia fimbriata]|uniref:Uncharacterized protein n=1 Tax=Aristolochia fimbriata TaxID=158543 RepID=A0AAV7FGA6_ARIFI|nr:hypothetical protein H6P81_003181 [Aristolochia fimbriata]